MHNKMYDYENGLLASAID